MNPSQSSEGPDLLERMAARRGGTAVPPSFGTEPPRAPLTVSEVRPTPAGSRRDTDAAPRGAASTPWYKREYHLSSPVKVEEVMNFTRQSSSFLRAGIPVLEFSLRHTSTQTEAGQARKVDVELPAIAFGPLAQRLAQAPQTDRPVMARGFLARRSLRSTQVVLHARDIEFQ